MRKGSRYDLAQRQGAKLDEARLGPVYTCALSIAKKANLNLALSLEISLVEKLVEKKLEPQVANCDVSALEGHVTKVDC